MIVEGQKIDIRHYLGVNDGYLVIRILCLSEDNQFYACAWKWPDLFQVTRIDLQTGKCFVASVELPID